MFEIKDKYKNYNCFLQDDSVYIYSQKEDKHITLTYFSKNKEVWNIKLNVQDEYKSISIWEDFKQCFLHYDGKVEVREKLNGQLISVYSQSIFSYNGAKFIEFNRNEENRRKGDIYLFEIKNSKKQLITKVLNIEKSNLLIINNQIISYTNIIIKSLNIFFWQTHFKDLCGVDTVYPQNEVLESNEKLYIVISSQGGRKGLFVLDLKTGKEIGFYKDLVFRAFKDNDFIYTSGYQNKFCKIDTKTNEIEEYELNEIVKKNGFESLHDHRYCVSNNILYFTQTLGSEVAKLGVIDLNHQTMVYKYDFPKESGAIGSIQVSNERIYVHTQDNTLHIFQKENPIV